MRVGLVAVVVTALALLAPAPAAADSLASAGVTPRPRTVESVERKLWELGYLPLGAVDKVFDGRSRAAVIAFQKWEGLGRDGIPGPFTQAALASAGRPEPVTTGRGTRIEILLDRQLLLLVEDGNVLRTMHVSTGRRGFATPAGEYSILRKRRRSWSAPYKVWLPWASYVVRGIAIHESRIVPVLPVSHGCVRVTRHDASWLFRRTPVGTPVTVLARSQQ